MSEQSRESVLPIQASEFISLLSEHVRVRTHEFASYYVTIVYFCEYFPNMYFLRFTMKVILTFLIFILMLMNLRHIYLSRFININMNVGNARMAYIVKWREYIAINRGRDRNHQCTIIYFYQQEHL